MKKFKKLLKKEIHQAFDGSTFEKEELKQNLGLTKRTSRRKIYILISSMSAVMAILLCILIPVLVHNNSINNNIPTYVKMTVEKLETEGNTTASVNHDDLIDEVFEYGESNEYKYYASKGEVISLNVHLRNPKAYEILSVTINNKKYQSLNFDPEYPSEKIIIPYKCSEESGIETITISEIKYVDGTDIKNGKIGDDRSIEIGIKYDILPSLSSKLITEGFTSIDFSFNILDSMQLLKQNMLRLVLIKDNSIIKNIVLNVGNNSISIDDLDLSTEYYYYVLAAYNCLDGKGYVTQTLDSGTVTTKSCVNIGNISINQNSISFNLSYDNDIVINKILLNNEEITILANKEYSINNLLSNHDYEITISYTYNNKQGEYKYSFKTNESNMSLITESMISAICIFDSIEVEVAYNDMTYIKAISFSIYDDTTLLATTTDYTVTTIITTSLTASLEIDKQYKLILDISYDLLDGNDIQSYSVEIVITRSM